MKQHEEYQVFNIYGVLCVKIYVSTSRKSTACFIRDESELTENLYKQKKENTNRYIQWRFGTHLLHIVL
jgi:hypothetical protein